MAEKIDNAQFTPANERLWTTLAGKVWCLVKTATTIPATRPSTGDLYTNAFISPHPTHKEKSSVFRSGERGGLSDDLCLLSVLLPKIDCDSIFHKSIRLKG